MNIANSSQRDRQRSRWWRRVLGDLTLGERGEHAAERFLKRQGMKVIGRRMRNQLGELDLIVTDKSNVIFVEVKTRSSDSGGEPHEAIDEDKQARLTRAALAFLKRHRLTSYPARFDVISVNWNPGHKQPEIEHLRNAFEAVGTGQMFN